MRDNRGFTLIELLIVISILTILSTMALPSYQDRVIRTQVAEAMQVAAVAQDAVQEYYARKGRLPNGNAEAGLPEAEMFKGNFVTSVEVSGGAVTLTLGNRVNKNIEGKHLTMRPAIVKSPKVPIAWVCGYASVPGGMSAAEGNMSDLDPRHVPVNCRY